MNYFRFIVNSNEFHTFKTVQHTHVDWLLQFKGKPLAASWQPLATALSFAESLGDFSHFAAHVPVVNQHALTMLAPLIGDAVEALPLAPNSDLGDNYFLLNVINVIDCLDLQRAQLEKARGIITNIRHYAFLESSLLGSHIFRIKGYEIGGVFVSEKFKTLVEENHLTGLMWHPLP